MKRFWKYLVVGGLMFLTSIGYAGTGKFDGNITSATVCINQNYDLYVPDADRLSVQAAYYTVTIASIGFTDGTRSTGTITVTANTGLTGSTLTINSQNFVNGIDWATGDKSSNTATNIYNVVTSTWVALSGINFSLANASTVIFATSSVVGTVGNYTFTSSTQSQLTVATMYGGKNSDIVYGGQARINKTNSYPLGLALFYTVQVGTSPTSLTPNTTYYAVPGDGTYFQLASSTQNAVDNKVIGFTKANYDNASTLVLTALSLTTTGYGFLWQASDDGDNWATLASSFSYTAAGNTLWDFSNYNYKYLRAAFTSSYTGAIKLILKYWGKF